MDVDFLAHHKGVLVFQVINGVVTFDRRLDVVFYFCVRLESCVASVVEARRRVCGQAKLKEDLIVSYSKFVGCLAEPAVVGQEETMRFQLL